MLYLAALSYMQLLLATVYPKGTVTYFTVKLCGKIKFIINSGQLDLLTGTILKMLIFGGAESRGS